MKLTKLLLSFALGIHVLNVMACDCVPKSFEQTIKDSKTILFGQIFKQEIKWIRCDWMLYFGTPPDSSCYSKDKKSSFCHPVVAYYIKVEKYFKQEINADTIIVISDYNSNCFKSLSTGFTYLFYLNRHETSDIYGLKFFSGISDCSRITGNKYNYEYLESGNSVNEFDYIRELFK
jgi:hypothetical protein